ATDFGCAAVKTTAVLRRYSWLITPSKSTAIAGAAKWPFLNGKRVIGKSAGGGSLEACNLVCIPSFTLHGPVTNLATQFDVHRLNCRVSIAIDIKHSPTSLLVVARAFEIRCLC